MEYSSIGIPLKLPNVSSPEDSMWNSVNLRDLFKAEAPDVIEVSVNGGVTRYKV